MSASHQRKEGSDTPPSRTPVVTARAPRGDFKVLRLAAQWFGGPEYVVCREANAVAHFFERADADAYVQWKNKNS